MTSAKRAELRALMKELVSFSQESADCSDWEGVYLLHDDSEVDEQIDKLLDRMED